jgi:hypothetical protein
MSLSNGFCFGVGISNNLIDYEVMRCTYKGELSTVIPNTGVMVQHTDSNGSLVAGNAFKITSNGEMYAGNLLLLDEMGAITRKPPSYPEQGLTITAGGTLTIGKFMVKPDGTMYMDGKIIMMRESAFNADTLNQQYTKSVFLY